jgi:AFG3 family protein
MFRKLLILSSQSIKRQFSNKKPTTDYENLLKSINQVRSDVKHSHQNVNFSQKEDEDLENSNPKADQLLTKGSDPLEPKTESVQQSNPEPIPSEPSSETPKSTTQDESHENNKKQNSSNPNKNFLNSLKTFLRSKFDSIFNRERYIWFFIIPVSMIFKEFYDAYKEMSFKTFSEEHFFEEILNSPDLQKVQITSQSPQKVEASLFDQSGAHLGRIRISDEKAFLETLDSQKLTDLGEEKFEVVHHASSFLSYSKPIILYFFVVPVIFWLIKNRSPNEFGRKFFDKYSKKVFQAFKTESKTQKKFEHVAGLSEAKQEILEFVQFLKNPLKFQKLGARLPRGALLVGPPGTGKTLLAKASAGEAGVPFYPVSGSEFVEMYVGLGASRVRDLFETARKNSPSIIFIDEIDAVGRKRETNLNSNQEADVTLNQLLVEMDGFDQNSSVVVLAATNRQDILDKALLRPGRFDRVIDLGLPDVKARQEILNVHLKGLALKPEFELEEYCRRISKITSGFSGADLSLLCNEGAIYAARGGKEFVGIEDFNRAAQKIALGQENGKKFTMKEKNVVSYHEAGHVIAAWFLSSNDPVLNISVLPRVKSPNSKDQYIEDKLLTKEQLLEKICMSLAGRVAEKIAFNKVTCAGADDLKKATQIAFNIVEKFGMTCAGHYFDFDRQSSDNRRETIEKEVSKLLEKCESLTLDLLRAKQELLHALAYEVMQKEVLDQDEIAKVLGDRPNEIKVCIAGAE